MNIYSTAFVSECPVNGKRINYELQIESQETIKVEAILKAVSRVEAEFHEDIADRLFNQFGGIQTIRANHHGVQITTVRGRL